MASAGSTSSGSSRPGRSARRSRRSCRLAAFESVQLFAERAAMYRQGFALDEANAAAVAAVCVRLDGIPLALELAAARLGSLSVSEISSRLDQRFRLLTTGKPYRLAPPSDPARADRLVLRPAQLRRSRSCSTGSRSSPEAGRWRPPKRSPRRGDAGEWQVLDLLAALVGKSLVQAEEIGGSTRYRLLETVRHYAAERLALRVGPDLQTPASPTAITTCPWSRPPPRNLRGPDEAVWLDCSRPSSTTSAPRWRSASPIPAAPSPACAWPPGCGVRAISRGHSGEVLEALGVLLGRPDARQPTRHLALALVTNCKLLTHFNRSPDIPSMAEEAITIARGLADDALAADALTALNWFRFLQGDLPAALARADEAVALATAAGNPKRLAVALGHRAVFRAETGDLDASLADYQEVLCIARAIGDNSTLVVTLINLGVDQVAAGEFPAALAYLQEALRLADAHGYQHLSAAAEMNLGFAYLMNADAASARRLLVGVLDSGASHQRGDLGAQCAPRPRAGRRRGRRPLRRRHPAWRRGPPVRAGRAGFRSEGIENARPVTMPGCATRSGRPRSMPPTRAAARSARPMPSPWP